MARLFGTDGIRGIAGRTLTAQFAFDLGCALGRMIKKQENSCSVVVGKDPRCSSSMLEAAVAAGLCSVGVDVILLGVVPTPAVSFAVVEQSLRAGVMISASHNSFEYNGIKIFGADGFKFSIEEELQLEELICNCLGESVVGIEVGEVHTDHLIRSKYFKQLQEKTAGLFENWKPCPKIAIDCANGSASETARYVFGKLKAQLRFLNTSPSGVNINRSCGATDMAQLKAFVVENSFDLGLAFDGDADRCLAVLKDGKVLDGDHISLILARFFKKKGQLKNNKIVVTNMSNLGFVNEVERLGFEVSKAEVGDRNVATKMREEGAGLGAETSGHVICFDYLKTGDGMLTAGLLLRAIFELGFSFDELGCEFKPLPQVLISVRVKDPSEVMQDPDLNLHIFRLQKELGEGGKLIVRASGTEPVIRILVQGELKLQLEKIAQELAEIINFRGYELEE